MGTKEENIPSKDSFKEINGKKNHDRCGQMLKTLRLRNIDLNCLLNSIDEIFYILIIWKSNYII